jgi:hypothetical protein
MAAVADHLGFAYAFTLLGGIMVFFLPFFFRLRVEKP